MDILSEKWNIPKDSAHSSQNYELSGWKTSTNVHSASSTQVYKEGQGLLSPFHTEHEKMASKLPFNTFGLNLTG